MIIRWQKQQEYYIVRMYQDLVGDWIVTQSWGNSTDDKNECNQTVAKSYQDARFLVREIRKQLKCEGFRLIARKETQLGFEFDPIHIDSPKKHVLLFSEKLF
ncbi:hypothetical protein ACMXYR_06305 [Neptuniibacter sp. QD29_5]|uniref:hypothetical protein n=1 Tax=Neptuniibacter sp. QD29_5 TaxID=3398207 RepID=UPI0039F52CFD